MSLITHIEYLIYNAKRKNIISEIDLINELEELLGNYRVHIESLSPIPKKHYFNYNTNNTLPISDTNNTSSISNTIKPIKKHYFNYNTNNTPPISDTNNTSSISNTIKPIKKYYNTQEDLTQDEIFDILIDLSIDINDYGSFEMFDIEQMKMTNPKVLKEWICQDKNADYNNQLVHNACRLNKTELVIWLIEHGFTYQSVNTIQIASNINYSLLSYYDKIRCEFDIYTGRKLIEKNYFDGLEFMFNNNLINSNSPDLKYLLFIALLKNRIFILEYLHEKKKLIFGIGIDNFKNIYDYDYNFMFRDNKILDKTLNWLWAKKYYWTKKQAERFRNNYMLKYVNNQIL